MSYIRTLKFVSTSDIEANEYSFSPSNYEGVVVSNKDKLQVRDILDRELKSSDKGIEVGSNCYISKSPFFFIRTKALQADYLLPQIDSVSTISILPRCYKEKFLKKGDLLISKDSNIGETVILDKDYDNFMISGGLYKLPISKYKYYLLAFLKTEFFKRQLSALVSKGSTLKHAKTLFLDCYIPFPKNNEQISYVESLVKALIDKEIKIKSKSNEIDSLIRNEINNNQKNIKSKISYPTLNQIIDNSRLDTGTYTLEFKKIDFQFKNYSNGFYLIPEKNIQSGNTPTERRISGEGEYEYLWITPTSISDFGTILKPESIRCKQNNLNSNALLIINRTSRGEEGEYVGIASFYDYSIYGKGQHNQGIYKITGLPDSELFFIACCLNSSLWRKYCGRLSLGSKMKEIKSSQLATIPFPNFPESKKTLINNLYFNVPTILDKKIETNEKYLSHDSKWNDNSGIFQLNQSYLKTKKHLLNIITKLIQGEQLELVYETELLY